jgi:hypothetical protein
MDSDLQSSGPLNVKKKSQNLQARQEPATAENHKSPNIQPTHWYKNQTNRPGSMIFLS